MRFALISGGPTPTNDALSRVSTGDVAWEWMSPHDALAALRPRRRRAGPAWTCSRRSTGSRTACGCSVRSAHAASTILNEPAALLAAHDKLLTSRLLRRAGIPHPRTWHVRPGRTEFRRYGSLVLKPRFGSWGREVRRCDDEDGLRDALRLVSGEDWFLGTGRSSRSSYRPRATTCGSSSPPDGSSGPCTAFRRRASGARTSRSAASGVRSRSRRTRRRCSRSMLRDAIGASLVGVDLLPDGRGGWVVAELNGAVEFTREYAPLRDVFAETAFAPSPSLGFAKSGGRGPPGRPRRGPPEPPESGMDALLHSGARGGVAQLVRAAES